jgi:hypothetical protein
VTGERDAAIRERDAARDALTTVTGERDTLRTNLTTVTGERDAALQAKKDAEAREAAAQRSLGTAGTVASIPPALNPPDPAVVLPSPPAPVMPSGEQEVSDADIIMESGDVPAPAAAPGNADDNPFN